MDTRRQDSTFGVVVLDRSVDLHLLGQIQVDPHANFLRGIDIGDEWDGAPFVVARRLANVLATARPYAGNWEVIAVGDHARFIDSASVATLRMAVAYGTNFQQGLALARSRKPRRIVVIAYSAPTAHWIGPHELDCFFSYPPCTETLDLTKAALDAAVAVDVRVDAVLIDDPTRTEPSWTGRLHEIHDLAADATFRSHGVLVQLQTPVTDKMIADVANAIATMALE